MTGPEESHLHWLYCGTNDVQDRSQVDIFTVTINAYGIFVETGSFIATTEAF
jgi:hypothetical protein